jgi:hypothetical protein
MKEAFDKISSYNIFNYLFPGIIFVLFAKYFFGYDFIQSNEFIGAFLYYFIGMIISRFGSNVIDPILKKTKILIFAEYKDFVFASTKDEKIEVLSEVNNTYRTIFSLIILLLILRFYNYLETLLSIPKQLSLFLFLIMLVLLFFFSYRKQTMYITKRIKIICNSKTN